MLKRNDGFHLVITGPDADAVLEVVRDDADARRTFLDEGTSPLFGGPYSEFGDWAVEADGERVRIDINYDEPVTVAAVISRGDYPSVCLPN